MVEVSDVIIQVLDARDPLACRSPEVERFVRRTNPDKRVVLLLNKIDLAPKENVQAWLKYFREEMPCVAFKCATGGGGTGGSDKLGSRALPTKGGYGGKDALGAETLLQLLKNYARNRNLKTAITVGIVGFPNVGKSSLINSLKRSRSAAAVGNTPGMTKVSKEIVLDKHVKLIDSPGVVFASSLGENAGVTALRNCVKVERLADPIAPVCEILRRCPTEQLMLMYKVGKFEDVDDFLRQVGRLQGKLKKGGVPDMLAAARIVLNDWNGGKIPYYTNPPERGDAKDKKHQVAEVVTNWGAEFDAEKVFEEEENAVIAGLPDEDDADVEFVPSKTAGVAVMDAVEAEDDDDEEEEEEAMDDDEEEEEDDEEDEMDRTDAGATEAALERATRGRKEGTGADEKKAAYHRSKVLYGAEGQLNPAQMRANKKKAKKIKAAVAKAGGRTTAGPISSGKTTRLARERAKCLTNPEYFQGRTTIEMHRTRTRGQTRARPRASSVQLSPVFFKPRRASSPRTTTGPSNRVADAAGNTRTRARARSLTSRGPRPGTMRRARSRPCPRAPPARLVCRLVASTTRRRRRRRRR